MAAGAEPLRRRRTLRRSLLEDGADAKEKAEMRAKAEKYLSKPIATHHSSLAGVGTVSDVQCNYDTEQKTAEWSEERWVRRRAARLLEPLD